MPCERFCENPLRQGIGPSTLAHNLISYNGLQDSSRRCPNMRNAATRPVFCMMPYFVTKWGRGVTLVRRSWHGPHPAPAIDAPKCFSRLGLGYGQLLLIFFVSLACDD